MTVYGQLPWLLSIVAYLLLAAFLALFWGRHLLVQCAHSTRSSCAAARW